MGNLYFESLIIWSSVYDISLYFEGGKRNIENRRIRKDSIFLHVGQALAQWKCYFFVTEKSGVQVMETTSFQSTRVKLCTIEVPLPTFVKAVDLLAWSCP